MKNFLRGKKTFGESNNLRKLLINEVSVSYFEELQKSSKDVIVCVSNLSLNKVEYKKLRDCSYADFIDWIWISCNYVPFMTLAKKNGCENAGGGLGCIIAIEEAIKQGATDIDAIILNTDFQQTNRVHSRNAFSDCIAIIEQSGLSWEKVLFHCFSEGVEEIKELNDRGGYASFTGIITFKNNEFLREALQVQGIAKLILETDSPYLSPEPKRGKENEPSYLPFIGEFLSGCLEVPVEEIAQQSYCNASKFYGLEFDDFDGKESGEW